LPSLTRTIETDVCVVGAGLLGLAHALEARRRGLSVVLLERGTRASGASVGHSGHLFFSALRAGAALDSAPLARERWIKLAQQAGVAVTEGGTLIVARHKEELAVMEAAAADPARRARMRSAKKLGRLAPIPVDGVLGAFHAKEDLRIGPRSAPAALARLLMRDQSARLEWGTHVHEIEPGLVHAGSVRVRAAAIVVCPGADRDLLPASLRASHLERDTTQRQMLRVSGPSGRRYRQTLATGLTLLEYPAFSQQADGLRLHERLELVSPELVERGVSPLLTQLGNGDLIVGSTATYTRSAKPFAHERLDELLLEQARSLLGVKLIVRQRWRSEHVSAGDALDDFMTARPMAGVRIVRAVRATAAALCHSHAGSVLDELTAGPPQTDMYIRVRDRRGMTEPADGVHNHAQAFCRPARSKA
jgi:FAD dependent oxidoreductase TIGR03364